MRCCAGSSGDNYRSLGLERFLYDPDTLGGYAAAALKPGEYVIGEEDHCWHEFTGVAGTDATADDVRTVEQFVSEVEAASASGWLVFEPGTVAA